MKIKMHLKNGKKWFRPKYHIPYLFFIILEVCTVCCYKFFDISKICRFIQEYKLDCHKLNSCDIQEFASFSSMIGMQALCAAIIIFLYSKYSERAHGIPYEFLVEHEIGKNTISIYRKTTLFLPFFCIFFNIIKWTFATVVSVLFMYYIIGVYVWLISILMRREKTSEIIKKMVKKEILNKEEVYDSYIFEEISYGYLKYMADGKVKLQTKKQIYQEIKSDIMFIVFNESNPYEFNFVIKNIYEEIAQIDTPVENINYIYMHDLIRSILENSFGLGQDWKIEIIHQIITILDNNDEINGEKKPYEVLYFALVCAVLYYGDKKEKDYLWYVFFKIEAQRNRKLAEKLFLSLLYFLELLRRVGTADSYFETIIKQSCRKIQNYLYYDNARMIIPYSITKCSVALALIGIDAEENIIACFNDIEEDLNNRNNLNYLSKTIIAEFNTVKEKLWLAESCI